jgi:hypothetical protein
MTDLEMKDKVLKGFNRNRIAENKVAYKYKPRYIRARAAKKAEEFKASDIDFGSLV